MSRVEILRVCGILASVPQNTQTDRNRLVKLLSLPFVLALIVTLANIAKPVVVDDTAYLAFARHIAAHPLDPYGFEIFWYTFPEPAFQVLCPPVIPYWLALGMRVFGEHVWALKLWLFPFLWLGAWAMADLLRRFAKGMETRVLPLLLLSPAVLATVNLMLDIPALALGLAAVTLFARASDRHSWWLAVVAGLLAGLAMQTKYTALLVPPAIVWYGLTHRQFRLAAFSAFVAFAVFALWELFLLQTYGQSHFICHALSQGPQPWPGETALAAFVRTKLNLAAPLAGHVGCLGIGVTLMAWAALGVARRYLAVAATLWAAGFLLILVLPHRLTVLLERPPPIPAEHSVASVLWTVFGTLFLFGLAGCAAMLLLRPRKVRLLRMNADSLFVVGWLLLELAGYFALTPFAGARRVIGLVLVGGIVAARACSRVERTQCARTLPAWVVRFAIGAGIAVAAIDTFDAWPEKDCAEQAANIAATQAPGSTVWFVGHWGFQYYCERAGMKQAIPGASILQPGDLLVLPAYPDAHGFYRPHPGDILIRPPIDAIPIATVVWDDVLSAQTIPNFYGGVYSVIGRDSPRLKIVVYQIRSLSIASD